MGWRANARPQRGALLATFVGLVYGCLAAGAVSSAGCAHRAGSGPNASHHTGAASLPDYRRTASELGLIINDDDPLSVRVGQYYLARRRIPSANVVHIRIPTAASLSAEEFYRAKAQVDGRLPARVQFLALAWTEPFQVQCMSVTSAFAYGFRPRNCATGCAPTPRSPYFDSESREPFRDFHMRPAMLLAASDFAQARALIERGVASDDSSPFGTAYLLDTSDRMRDVRAASFTSALLFAPLLVQVRVLKADALRNRSDVMFYFTGVARVAGLDTLHFLPGAIADHLTSFGGELIGSPQMSSLDWLQAGATGSYGTVVEPCNIAAKFPSVPVVLKRYLSGETLIEAYWKSVAEPSQGLFIGEPLARPFGQNTRFGATAWSARTPADHKVSQPERRAEPSEHTLPRTRRQLVTDALYVASP